MKGWQYRWFVLDETSGLLSYYTSKDKMMRGARRGCVRLKGAIIGIDDEDDSTFTITVDQKTFHFQARDADERQNWIEGLENTIMRHSNSIRRPEMRDVPSSEDFERKLLETDAYLQILIDQYKVIEAKIDQCEDLATKEKYNVLKVTAEAMIEAIKHSIMSLQIAKGPLANGILVTDEYLTSNASNNYFSRDETEVKTEVDLPRLTASQSMGNIEQAVDAVVLDPSVSVSVPNIATDPGVSLPSEGYSPSLPVPVPKTTKLPAPVPETSYSSSEEDDFYDAEDFKSTPQTSPERVVGPEVLSNDVASKPTVIAADDDYFDELYDDRESERLESLEKHGSIITHLLGPGAYWDGPD
ncbi:oxysterol-binding protein-related protein 9-like isoform X2 [Liolophura sinensis]|uniref:oxysterol-binding protein-related protein 9-like isoform X2 n=1 Tax=Liolophura sinensis TaxID=3198878 RepID=UPI003158F61F